MSKIERLNARVAKLLTAAVHEVLEVVRETVSEYQEKTARTQRENESLRRRLRELQDKVKRVGTRTTQHLSLPVSGERVLIEQQQHCNQEWSSNLRQGTEFPPTEDTQELPEQHSMKQRNEECNRLELTHLESETECDILVPELNAISTDCVTQITDAGLSVFAPHPVINNSNLDPLCPETSSFCMLPNLGSDEIKTEPEPLEYTISEQQTTKNNFYNCTDSSSNIAQTEVTEEPHEFNTGSHAMVYIHPDHSNFEERFSFQKTSRSILDAQKQKQFHRHEEQHRCLLCGKTFSRVGNLRIHQRCHTGEKPYCCIQCGRCFSHAGNLKKHKRVHTGERPYSCHQCGKTFSQSSHLKKHLKIHIIRHLSVS